MDMEMIDGYDELPPAAQEKVKRALEQGHVDDDDWNGVRDSCRISFSFSLMSQSGYRNE